jgi:ribulose-5-phosphate 4-epimerase/fuculose-1-phosphate aldolase
MLSLYMPGRSGISLKGKAPVMDSRGNSFPLSDVLDAKARVANTMRNCARQGLVVGQGGNSSMVLRPTKGDGGLLIIKGTGQEADEMTADLCPVLDLTSEKVIPVGGKESVKPSCEWPTHLMILKGRTDASAVVHTHNDVLNSLALADLPIELMIPDDVAVLKTIFALPVIDYVFPAGQESARAVTEVLMKRLGTDFPGHENDFSHSAVMIKNHGPFCVGANLTQAFDRALLTESLAKRWSALFSLVENKTGTIGLSALPFQERIKLIWSDFERFRDALAAKRATTCL